MAATDKQWARGYALQALSDLRVRETLVRANAEKCHRLHYLQMAAEKVCKAHLNSTNGHDSVRNSHAYIESILPIIARHFYGAISDNNQIKDWEIRTIRTLAHEIQLLAPACHDGDMREDNSEYPWEGGQGTVYIPCEYSFPNINDGDRAIVKLIHLIRAAAQSYSSVSKDAWSTGNPARC